MNVFIIFEVDHLEAYLANALTSNDRAAVATCSNDLRRAFGVLKSWAQSSGGACLVDNLSVGVLEVPAEKMSTLPDMRRQFESLTHATISVGVGMEMQESFKALQIAKHRGGDQIALYVPEMQEELEHHETMEKAEGDAPPPAAAPSAPTAPQEESKPQDPKTAVVQALQELKAKSAEISQLKESNPDAFQAIVNAVQAMIILAQGMTQDDVQKSEDEETVGEDHDSEESSSSEDDLDKTDKLPMPKETPKRKPHVVAPIGSIVDEKVKVEHKDPATGAATGTGWVEARSGLVMGKENHPVSARKQNAD